MRNKKTVIETQRLFLREMEWDDLPALCTILQDPQVMYAYAHAFDRQECEAWLNNQLRRYREDGFGLWAVILKATNEMIGQCGLTYQDLPGQTVVEIGYLFQKDHWHRGYATESARGCKAYAFDSLGLDAVYSIIRDTNTRSQQVAIRNGMTQKSAFIKHYYGIRMPHLVFSVQNNGQNR